MPDPQTQMPASSELRLRVISSIVLAMAALLVAWLGGTLFLLFWALAAFWVWMEWTGIVGASPRNAVQLVGGASILAMTAALHYDAAAIAAVIAIIGAGVVSATANEKRAWVAAGIVYAALVLVPAVILRADPRFGFIAMVWLFAAVWTADVAAYFTGRFFGGPLLAPHVSPKKTWSGALGGLAGGVIASSLIALLSGLPLRMGLVLTAAAIVIASQIGDLLESGIKRHFGVKDAGQLIPGHGGMMDRLDGFLIAALCALLIGVVRAGTGTPAAGLLVW